MDAVQSKFDTFDYGRHMRELLALWQKVSVEAYPVEFESLRYQVAMHNCAMDETFLLHSLSTA